LASDLLGRPGIDRVITDTAKGPDIITHQSAKGRNDLADQGLATILMFPNPDRYARLNVIAQRFGLNRLVNGVPEIIGLLYRDMLDQAIGRNRGMRRIERTPTHIVVMSHGLFVAFGKEAFMNSGRYRL